MKKIALGVIVWSAIGFVVRPAWPESPCDTVDRRLSDKSKAVWAPEIAKQLLTRKVDVLQSFRFNGWSIIYVDSHDADESFLFYSGDPIHSRYITEWSGAAAFNEEQSIRAWTLKNAPGIPPRLASCFAWYVVNDRGK